MKIHGLFLITAASILAAGCSTTDKPPLVFVQSQTLGITANASGSTATPELSLGFRDLDVALVPVANGGGVAGNASDAYSVIGQFNAGATAGPTPQANLGKFFATGIAARNVSDGFRTHLVKSAN